MKKLLLLTIILLLSKSTFSQMCKLKEKEVADIKQSILVVSLEEEKAKTIKKLEKNPDELKYYKSQIAGRNNSLKDAALKYWNLTDSVVVLPVSEVEELQASNNKIIVLKYGEYLEYTKLSKSYGSDGNTAGWKPDGSYNKAIKYTALSNVICKLNLSGFGSEIDIYMPNILPSYSDAIYGVKQLQYVINYHDTHPKASYSDFRNYIAENNVGLKGKTLLLDKKDINKSITESSIKELYPYPVKIVDQDFIDNAIIKESAEYAYVQVVNIPGGKGNVNFHLLSNPANGEIYCMDMPKVAFQVKGTSFVTYNQRIKEKNLKNYIKNIK
ncbi:hypothetical protein [Saccharicrinis aurantiacus]|uniref:hypothetical protein n=1 Tax=Saccharicrinis aurantiacus TaxID=1849719 RepID=UPI00094FB14B|nr:hypothetical protein [Saccharicrinis aurantiacus]